MAYYKTRDGCSLYYETVGFEFSRPVIVFLNGTLQSTVYWKRVASALKPSFSSLLYDARGQGASDLGDLALSLDLHLEDLEALIRHLGLGAVSLVGLSHGARLAYALAVKQPKAVTRMVLCAIGLRSSIRARLIVRSWIQILEKAGIDAMVHTAIPHVFGEAYLVQSRKIIDRIAKTIVRRNRSESLQAHLAAMARYPRMGSMAQKLNAPLLVLSGSEDLLVEPAGAKALALKSGGVYLTVTGAGHSIPVENTELFVSMVSKFLSGQWIGPPEGH